MPNSPNSQAKAFRFFPIERNPLWVRVILLLSIIPLLAITTASCTAPILREAGVDRIDLLRFPDRTQIVELNSEDDSVLRGVLVPSEVGVQRRGVSIHFLPSGASITTGLEGGFGSITHLLELYSQRGWDCIAVDYRGIGASDGSRNPDHIQNDADVILAFAKASMNEGDLLVIRGVSLGSLAIAAVLAAEGDPDGVIIHAPIRATTIVSNGARDRYGSFLGWLVALVYSEPEVPDLLTVLERSSAALIVVGEEDPLFSPSDRSELLSSADSNATDIRFMEGLDHVTLVLRSFCFELSAFSGQSVDHLPQEEDTFLKKL